MTKREKRAKTQKHALSVGATAATAYSHAETGATGKRMEYIEVHHISALLEICLFCGAKARCVGRLIPMERDGSPRYITATVYCLCEGCAGLPGRTERVEARLFARKEAEHADR